jgi:hypothetical protein
MMEPRLKTTKEEKRMLQPRTWFEGEEGGSVCNRKICCLHQNHTSTKESVTGLNSRNSIDFDEIMAVAMETIMKNKLMQERVSERVED